MFIINWKINTYNDISTQQIIFELLLDRILSTTDSVTRLRLKVVIGGQNISCWNYKGCF